MSALSEEILDKVRGAMWGLYIGDAIAMPVHWYYNRAQLKLDFGKITKYEKPKSEFPGSIMNKSSTGGGGRGSDEGSIVGDVILHGKKKFWMKGKNYHYHHGMAAGENTLEAQITRLYTRNIISNKGIINKDDLLNCYDKFMTTPGTHNDTYAATCHRMFFANKVNKQKPLSECADNDGHNVNAIDALTTMVPYILHNVKINEENERLAKSVNDSKIILSVCRNSDALDPFINAFSKLLLHAIFQKTDFLEKVQSIGQSVCKMNPSKEAKHEQDPMTACYINSSFPALLIFCYKYADNFEEAILASANAGGENVARGSALGSILGAYHGYKAIPKWMVEGLSAKKEIEKEIEAFITLIR